MAQVNILDAYQCTVKINSASGAELYSGVFAAGESRGDTFTDAGTSVAFSVEVTRTYPSPAGAVVNVVNTTYSDVAIPLFIRVIPQGLVFSDDAVGGYFMADDYASSTPGFVDVFVNFEERSTQYIAAKNSNTSDAKYFGIDASSLPNADEVSMSAAVQGTTVSMVPLFGRNELIGFALDVAAPSATWWTDFVGCVELL